MAMNLTIFVPTMDRPKYVRRLLQCYTAFGFDGVLFIGDSSEGANLNEMKELVREYAHSLNIHYHYFPRTEYINDAWCLADMAVMAETKYAVYCGDDDMLVPDALQACMDFLDRNPEYVAAHGYRIEYGMDERIIHGDISWVRTVKGLCFEEPGAPDRLAHYLGNAYSIQYCVHPVAVWRQMYADVKKVRMRYVGPELLPCSLSVIAGKIREFDMLSTIFHVHDNHFFSWSRQSIYSLMVSADWYDAVTIYRHRVTEQLERHGHSDAAAFVDRELWRHLNGMMGWQFPYCYPGDRPTPARRLMDVAIRLQRTAQMTARMVGFSSKGRSGIVSSRNMTINELCRREPGLKTVLERFCAVLKDA